MASWNDGIEAERKEARESGIRVELPINDEYKDADVYQRLANEANQAGDRELAVLYTDLSRVSVLKANLLAKLLFTQVNTLEASKRRRAQKQCRDRC